MSYIPRLKSRVLRHIINKKTASPELKHILLRRSGYRTDDKSELADIINHQPKSINILSQEILDLENTDIIDTLSALYDFNALTNDEEATENTVKAINDFIKKSLNTDAYHLVWLCDTAHNASHHSNTDGSLDSVYAADLKKHDLMPVSDLGPEGALLAYK